MIVVKKADATSRHAVSNTIDETVSRKDNTNAEWAVIEKLTISSKSGDIFIDSPGLSDSNPIHGGGGEHGNECK